MLYYTRELTAKAIIYIRPMDWMFGCFKTKPDRSITIPSSVPSVPSEPSEPKAFCISMCLAESQTADAYNAYIHKMGSRHQFL